MRKSKRAQMPSNYKYLGSKAVKMCRRMCAILKREVHMPINYLANSSDTPLKRYYCIKCFILA